MSDPLSGSFIKNGAIQYGALFSALLGAGWLVFVGGLITVWNAIVTLHVRLLEQAQIQYVRLINAVLGGGAELSRASWAIAFEAAVDTAPLLAPALFVLEVVLAWVILGTVWDRQEVL